MKIGITTIVAVILASVLLGLSPAGSLARTAVGTLEGTVVDAQGNIIDGATVTIQTSDGQHPHVTRTDGSGHFSFSRFAAGQYDLRAYSKGAYSDWVKRIAIRSRKPTQITLRIVSQKTDSKD